MFLVPFFFNQLKEWIDTLSILRALSVVLISSFFFFETFLNKN